MHNSSPAISVLLPVYNAESALAAALDSLLAQTEPDFEIIAVDNGSTDGSRALLRKYQERDARLQVHTLEKPCLVTALNFGLAQSRGRFIARMDADDVSHPERLSLQRRRLEAEPSLGVVASRVEFGGSSARAGGYARFVEWTNTLLDHASISLSRFIEAPVAHPAVMLRCAELERCGAWRLGDFPEDYELWLRLLEQGVRFEKLPEVLLRWNDPPERLSRSDARYSMPAFYRLKAQYLAAYLKQVLAGRPLFVWGAGRSTRKRAELLEEHGIKIAAWVDIDPDKVNRRVAGIPVLPREALPGPDACYVVPYVARWGARAEISQYLEMRGFQAGADYIAAA